MGRRRQAAEGLERRVPWVSYALVCLCALGFAYAQTEALEIDAVAEPQLEAAAKFFEGHPYLALPSILEARISPETARQLAQEYELQRQRLSSLPRAPRLIAREQRELDEMAGLVARKLESRPERVFGVRASERSPVTYLVHVLFHGGVAHLAICMLLLSMIGRKLEDAWGSAIQLCAVSAAILGSVGAFVLQASDYPEPLIGSSGLVAGLLAAFIVRFAGAREKGSVLPLLVLGALGLGLPPWLGYDWSIARSIGSLPPDVGGWNPSMWGLVGGFAAGATIAAGARLLGLEGRIEREEVETEIRRSGLDIELDRALQDLRVGASDEAFRRLAAILEGDPNHEAASLAFWEVCNEVGQPETAAPYVLRVLRQDVRSGNAERAVETWLDLVRSNLDRLAEPALLLRMAPLLRDAGDHTAAVRALRHALMGVDETNNASVASRVAREAEELDPETAVDAVWQALSSLEIEIEERQSLEELLGRIVASIGNRAHERAEHAHGAEYRPAAVEPAEPVAEPEAETEAIALDERDRELELVAAVPLAFEEAGLVVEVKDSRKRIPYDRVDALAVAAVEGLAERPVVVIDLVLNWMTLTAEALKVIRLRTDQFDPRGIMTDQTELLDSVRAFAKQLLEATGATPLPDLQSVSGLPFAAFKAVHQYHRDVLLVDDGGGEDEDA